MVTFVQATYALVTFVQISNISALTGPILKKKIKFQTQKFYWFQNIFEPKFLWTQNFFRHQVFFKTKILIRLKILFEIFFGPKIFLDQNFLKPSQAEHFRLESCCCCCWYPKQK